VPVTIHVPVKVSWIQISVFPVCRIIIHVEALGRLREKKNGKYKFFVLKSHIQK
jgi:hypothetical protein